MFCKRKNNLVFDNGLYLWSFLCVFFKHTACFIILISILCSAFQSKFAKALYDNAAECVDELAFRKGDIVMVMEQNVSDTSGWWNCSLHGRRGLAPANRLVLLPQTVTVAGPLRHGAEEPAMNKAKSHVNVQNIYQIPSPPRPISTVTYERMDMMCKDLSLPSVAPSSQIPRQETNGPGLNKVQKFHLCAV